MMPTTNKPLTDEQWLDFWKHFKGLDHQKAAVLKLGRHIRQMDHGLLHDSAEWVGDFRTQPDNWATIRELAAKTGAKHPDLVAAQFALESNWGRVMSGKNNPFGLKGKGTEKPTTEVINGEEVLIEDEFKDFASIGAAVEHLVSRWYKDYTAPGGKKYKGVNRAATRGEAARLLQKEGYATDPDYAMKLIKLMDDNAPARLALAHANPLLVAWENQNNNASGTGYRECFSSSCAMLARFWGKVSSDDDYNVIRARYGDTTSAEAQLAALRSLGLTANFATNGQRATLEKQIHLGRPVAVGWLHHGSTSAPSGGGHWSVVIGFTEAAAIHNDPNGEANLVHGGYTANTNGAGQHYSWKNWLPRWEADGPGTGWLLTCYP